MKIIGERPLRVPPRASGIPRAKNFRIVSERQNRRIVGTSKASAIPQVDDFPPVLTTQQIFRIARIFDPTVEDDLAEARTAWRQCQSTRKRDAVYHYLRAVFEIVARWKEHDYAKSRSQQALRVTGQPHKIRTDEPFTVVIFCTSDPRKLDLKTRSKWSRTLRYAERSKAEAKSLRQFIKSKGGINECARRFSDSVG